MNNFIQAGNVITLPAPYAVSSGNGLLVGAIFGVATGSASSGAEVEAWVGSGVVRLTALGTDTGSVGTKVYWDNTNRRVTVTSTSNTFIGVLTVAKTSGQTTADVRINGTANP